MDTHLSDSLEQDVTRPSLRQRLFVVRSALGGVGAGGLIVVACSAFAIGAGVLALPGRGGDAKAKTPRELVVAPAGPSARAVTSPHTGRHVVPARRASNRGTARIDAAARVTAPARDGRDPSAEPAPDNAPLTAAPAAAPAAAAKPAAQARQDASLPSTAPGPALPAVPAVTPPTVTPPPVTLPALPAPPPLPVTVSVPPVSVPSPAAVTSSLP